jgi:phosphoglycolate phosphatase
VARDDSRAYDALIFDLDGTLWDAAAASTYGWNLALREMGLASRVTLEGIRSVSGLPFFRCVEVLLPELRPVPLGLLEALDRGERAGVEKIAGVLYEGVAEGIPRLAGAYRLFMVSNCPDWYLDKFLQMTGFETYLNGYDCNGLSGKGKPEMLSGLRQRHELARPVYVGDTQGDREAAAQAGMDFAFASYGFGAADGAELSFGGFGEMVEHFLGPHPE